MTTEFAPMKRRVLYVTDDNENLLNDLITPSSAPRLTRFSAGQVRPSIDAPFSSSSAVSPSHRKERAKEAVSSVVDFTYSSLKTNTGSPRNSPPLHRERSRSPSLGRSLMVAYDDFLLLDGDHHFSTPRSREHALELYIELRKCLQFLQPYVKDFSAAPSQNQGSVCNDVATNKKQKIAFSDELDDSDLAEVGLELRKRKLKKEAKNIKKLTFVELREKLKGLKLPSGGSKVVLQSRLKKYYRSQVKEDETNLHCSHSLISDSSSEKSLEKCTFSLEQAKESTSCSKREMNPSTDEVVSHASFSTDIQHCSSSAPPLPPPPLTVNPAGRLSALLEDEPFPVFSSTLYGPVHGNKSPADEDSEEELLRLSSEFSPPPVNGEWEHAHFCQAPVKCSSDSLSSSNDFRERAQSRSSSFLEFSNCSSHIPSPDKSEDDENDTSHMQTRTSVREDAQSTGTVGSAKEVARSSSYSQASTQNPHFSARLLPFDEDSCRGSKLSFSGLDRGEQRVSAPNKDEEAFLEKQSESCSYSSDENFDEGIATGIWGTIKNAGNRLLKSVVPLSPRRSVRGKKRSRSPTEQSSG